MEANLVDTEAARPKREFPYSNWGPWAAILAVFAALAVGLFLSVPALLVGSQEGKIEALFPPSYSSGASLDKGDATALAVDGRTNRLFADHEDEVRAFGALGEEIGAARIGGLEDSHGLAFDPSRGVLAVSEEGPGRIQTYDVAGKGKPRRLASLKVGGAGFEPERMAYAPAKGSLYVIDKGSDKVVVLNAAGGSVNALTPAESSGASSFDFGTDDNDIAVDTAPGAGRGTVYVLSGKGDGKVFAFSPAGRYLWELKPESRDEFAALAVDSKGNLWIAEPNGDLYEYGRASGSEAPQRTGAKVYVGNSVSAVEFAGSGHLFVARELDGKLTTLGSIISQLGTELGFLLVPFALASMRGSSSIQESLRRLGFRRFKRSAFGWMALTFVLYLGFTIFYSLVITEPKQKDIAESFGPTAIQVLLIVIAAPIAEETCFRGMLFGGLREKLPRLAAALICGLIFGALHALTGITAVPPLIVFGFLLALLYERTGSIVPGILLHMINNSIALLGQ
ncbi:MAG: CPBP family intramembrane metalloprotease [Actinobacteria bacterium]|nr:CPBP family intramembrane metalloprotease [Actinomycetota bacterium]